MRSSCSTSPRHQRGAIRRWTPCGAFRAAIRIPLTVGGGVRSVADARRLLGAGADKVSVNTAAVRRPDPLE